MGKSSITNIVKADRKNSTEPFGKIKDQLDETQALSWRMEQYMAESRNVLTSCVRLKSELQYDYFTELVLEAAKTSEKLTDKLRRLTLEVTVNPVQYENYKAELVTIHVYFLPDGETEPFDFAETVRTTPYKEAAS